MIGAVTATDTHRAIDAVWRIESARLIAGLARIVRDVGAGRGAGAGRAGRRARAVARVGRPGQPGRLADGHRQASRDRPAPPRASCSSASTRSSAASSRARPDEPAVAELDAALDDDVGDDLLRLMFIACHPVLSTEARVALTLRLLGGLTTDEIARAFLVPEPTIAQRIVRAKRTLAEPGVPFEVPRGAELAARLASVLEVDLPDLQRGLLGDRRRRLDAARRCARTRCASAASWPSSPRTSPRSTAWSR